jgi:hypothetical protein
LGLACALQLGAQAGPATIVLRGDALAHAKALVVAGDASVRPAVAALRRDAEKEMTAPIVAVTDKKSLLPPSGDPHDYFSLSPYWWPDPSKPDGLPYIRRDGETNPESKKDLDRPRLGLMVDNVSTLALAWYLTDDSRYAMRAAVQLRAWFLDPATRMTPHLHYAQLVRGNPAERGSGIIDTHNFVDVVDAAILLEGSTVWSAHDAEGLRRWMSQYLAWLNDSPNGKHERAAKNNHGSWYAAQTATLAMYAGDTAYARATVEAAKTRIGAQITPEGRQPEEMVRTRSMHYSGFNADALSCLAEIGRHVGIDLWNYQAPNGGSLRRALDHLAEFVPHPADWPGQQIDAIDQRIFIDLLRRAQAALGGPVYAAALAKLPAPLVSDSRSALLYP